MGITEKVVEVLSKAFPIDYMRIEDDDGISGFVISARFRGMSMLDRQGAIGDALEGPSSPLTPKERGRVLMIAGLTPEEYEVVGTPVRILKVEETGEGAVRIVVRGGLPDADSVSRSFAGRREIRSTKVNRLRAADEPRAAIRLEGSPASPLTKAKVLDLLRKDRYVHVAPGA